MPMLKSYIEKSLFTFTLIISGYTHAQEFSDPLTRIAKLNFINPGIEWQKPVAAKTLLSVNVGVGYNGSYPKLTETFKSGGQMLIAPFLDIQSRYYWNRKKRFERQKIVKNNSGSFVATRFLLRGPSIVSTFTRTSEIDMALGLGYGFQKSKSKLNFAMTLAPYFYFDDKGNYGFFPIIPELSLGYNLNR